MQMFLVVCLLYKRGNNVVTYTFDFGGCSFSTTATVVGIDAPVCFFGSWVYHQRCMFWF